MKRFLKTVLMASLCLTLCAAPALAEVDPDAAIPDENLTDVAEVHDDEISILCVGNSILRHFIAEDLGWYNEWGMAASSKDKDYYHLLQKWVAEEGYTNVKWSMVTISPVERAIQFDPNYTYEREIAENFAEAVEKAVPDIVIFQIGENSGGSEREAYCNALIKLTDYCKKLNPDVYAIYSMPFWGGEEKCAGVRLAAYRTGFTYGDISVFCNTYNMAIGKFAHSGVASHPGDTGMENIAKTYMDQLRVVLDKKYVHPDKLLFKYDGKYISGDVESYLYEDRTMLPVGEFNKVIGIDASYNEKTKIARFAYDGVTIEMMLGQKFLLIDGKKAPVEMPITMIDDKVCVPLRFVAEAYGFTVGWDEKWTTVSLSHD